MCDDFLKFKKIKADLVFLNPNTNDENTYTEPFSIFKHITPDIRESLEKALSMT